MTRLRQSASFIASRLGEADAVLAMPPSSARATHEPSQQVVSALTGECRLSQPAADVIDSIASIETPAMCWLRNAAARLKEMDGQA